MKRREFLNTSLIAGVGLPFTGVIGDNTSEKNPEIRDVFSVAENKISIYTRADIKPTRIFHISDTHLALDDDRGVPYKEFSQRMGDAYKKNTHFENKKEITCAEGFEYALKMAQDVKADFLALTGDIFSFPSEASVEWALQKLQESGIPFGYVAGNHDWHYEGMKGSLNSLRNTWIENRLKPMYHGQNPLFFTQDVNGIRLVFIDNSTYEIEKQQLAFFRMQVESGLPLVLFIHIPLYMPGHNIYYGCANPDWGEKTDRGYEWEKREKWPKEGHTQTTFDFYNEVFEAPNVLGIFAGHTHQPAVDIKNGIPQIVSGPNLSGYFSEIEIRKASK